MTERSRKYSVVVLILGLFICECAFAQANRQLERATSAFESLDYRAARDILTALIENPARATTRELARGHLLLGIIDYSENEVEAARTRFRAAVQLDRDIRPNPLSASPKIVEFFDEVAASVRNTTQSDGEIRYVTLVDPRPGAALRSMILPGWGQYHKGEHGKALAVGGAWVLTAGATAVVHGARRRARNRYLEATDPETIPDLYDRYNRYHKARNTLALAAAGVWLAAYVDALASPGRRTIAPVTFIATPTRDGAIFHASVRF